MAENRGKQFELIIRDAFEQVSGVSIDRLYDNQSGYSNIATISDFIVYKEPYEYYIECKSVHGNTLSIHSNDPKKKYGLITNKQWEGMLEKSKIQGVFAGVICWWIDHDTTKFIPIQVLEDEYISGKKSIRFDADLGEGRVDNDSVLSPVITLHGKKKRVFWDYDMGEFFNHF